MTNCEVSIAIAPNARSIRMLRADGYWIVWLTPHNPEGYGSWLELYDNGTIRQITHLPDDTAVREIDT